MHIHRLPRTACWAWPQCSARSARFPGPASELSHCSVQFATRPRQGLERLAACQAAHVRSSSASASAGGRTTSRDRPPAPCRCAAAAATPRGSILVAKSTSEPSQAVHLGAPPQRPSVKERIEAVRLARLAHRGSRPALSSRPLLGCHCRKARSKSGARRAGAGRAATAAAGRTARRQAAAAGPVLRGRQAVQQGGPRTVAVGGSGGRPAHRRAARLSLRRRASAHYAGKVAVPARSRRWLAEPPSQQPRQPAAAAQQAARGRRARQGRQAAGATSCLRA